MAINETIWGSSETWVNVMNGTCKTISQPMRELLDDTLELNKLIDNSMCWCGAVQNERQFYLANIGLIMSLNPYLIYPALKINEIVNIPYMYCVSCNSDSYPYYNTFEDRWGRWAEVTGKNTDNMGWYPTGNCKPLFNIRLNELIFVATVTAYASNSINESNYDEFSLSDWIHEGHVDYPYLSQLFIEAYYNQGTEENPNFTPCYDSTDNYIYFVPNAETSDEIQEYPDSNLKIAYDWTQQANKKHYTQLMGLPLNRMSLNGAVVCVDNNPDHYIHDNDYIRYSRQYSDELLDDIRSQIAFLGVFYVGDYIEDINDITLTHPSVYCGIIDDGGLTHGQYSHGQENEERQQFSWDDTSDSNYDPSNPPKIDPNTYGVSMHTNYPWLSSPNRLYSINATNVLSITTLYAQLWTCYNDNNVGTGENQISPSEFNFDEFLTVSPIDTIVSLKLFPYDTSLDHNPIGIKLGRYQTQIPAYNAGKMTILEFGKVNIFAYFGAAIEGDWRDRETRYTLYAPFCGTLDLDPAFYMGHDVYLEYWIDQITGACTAALYIYDNDGAVVYGDTVSGVCAVDIPLTGVDQATIQSQIFNSNQQLKLANINAASSLINSTLDIAGNAFSGNAAGAATSAIGGITSFLKNNAAVESAQYQLHHNKMTPRQLGAASPLCAMLGDWIPRIIISKPKDALSKAAQQEFSQTKGFACMIPGKIGSRTGFIQMINVHLIPPADATIAMTEGEAEMIRSLLAGGIYI